MLRKKQTRMTFLWQEFLKSECVACIAAVTTLVILCFMGIFWVKGNIMLAKKGWFDEKGLLLPMMLQIIVLVIVVMFAFAIRSTLQIKKKNPGLSYQKCFVESELFECCMVM